MAIRLKLRLAREGKSVEVVALVNSGYETLEPEVLVPPDVARSLSRTPTYLKGLS